MKDKTGNEVEGVRGVVSAPFSSWYGWGAIVVTLAAVAALGYWFRQEIVSAYASAEEAVLATLGLGVAPVALWLVVFLWSLGYRRSWFRRLNLWIGSLVFGVMLLGVLAFFQPNDGLLASFTLEGEVSLGGDIGYAIAGPIAWEGALRLLGLFVLGAAITTPRLALDLAAALGKLLVYTYVLLVVALRTLFTALRHIYRFQPETRFGERSESVRTPDSPERSGDLKAYPVTKPISASIETLEEIGAGSAGLISEAPAATAELASPDWTEENHDELQVATPEYGPDLADEPELEETVPVAGKYNRFWDQQRPDPAGLRSPDNGLYLEEDHANENEVGGGPILDPMGGSWQRPRMDMLVDAKESGVSDEQMAETAETIKRTLAEYGVEVEIGQVKPGPVVTMYGLIPGWVRRHKQVRVTDEHGNPKLDESGKHVVSRVEARTRVKVDSILSREKDLALALKTLSIRIETPAMGESLVGIEVPNPSPSLVALRGVMESKEFKRLRSSARLPIAFGKGSGGETVVVDLADMPHLLIAGATGSGKSVCINTIVSCLIMEKTPAEMRLLLVDPKRVELTPYNGIPHLLTPVVVETDQVVALLKGLIREMLNRYRRLEEVSVRNIDGYNRKMPDKMPYLVVVVDELADLMMSASFDVEQSLCRLAQLGRATGIHLIVATQRPSVDVVTGLIKANFPSRISFGVTSQIDSRTILDTAGAEKLLGRGDLLYLAVDASRPERAQGVFISDREIEDLVEFWRTTPWAPLPRVSLHTVGDDETDEEDAEDGYETAARDELLGKAIQLARQYNKLSTSLLQRRMRIGYPRAARLMDQLEAEGIVGPIDGSKSRDVIMSKMEPHTQASRPGA